MATYAYLSAIPTLLLLICEVVVLVLVLIRLRGQARSLAAGGVGLLILVLILQNLYGVLLAYLVRGIGGVGVMSAMNLGVNTVFAVVSAGALVLIGFAIARRPNSVVAGGPR